MLRVAFNSLSKAAHPACIGFTSSTLAEDWDRLLDRKKLGVVAATLALGLSVVSPACAENLRDIIQSLYGGDGIDVTIEGVQKAQSFNPGGRTAEELDVLGSSLFSNLGLFAFNSARAGFNFDMELGVPVKIEDSFGPLIAERANTLGEGKFSFAFSYTRLEFKRFKGTPIDELVLTTLHPDFNGDGFLGPTPAFPQLDLELDQIETTIDLKVSQDIFAFFGTYGLTDVWDVGLIVPVIYARVRADAFSRIIDNSPVSTRVLLFDPAIGDAATSSEDGAAFGLGDVILRTKLNFLRDAEVWPDMAIIGQATLPTGKEEKLLGSGHGSFMGMLVASKKFDWLTPHVNLGYEAFSVDHTRNNVRYLVGADARLHEDVTAAAGIVGRYEPNGDGVGDHIVDLAAGLKWSPYEDFLLSANILVPLNRDRGLRPRFVWTAGLEITF